MSHRRGTLRVCAVATVNHPPTHHKQAPVSGPMSPSLRGRRRIPLREPTVSARSLSQFPISASRFLSTSRVCEFELRGTCAFVTSGATTLYADAAATYSSQGRSSDALVWFRCLWVSRTFIGWRNLPCYMPSSERLWVIMSMQCSGHFRPSCFRFS